jgi:hypothetical protein
MEPLHYPKIKRARGQHILWYPLEKIPTTVGHLTFGPLFILFCTEMDAVTTSPIPTANKKKPTFYLCPHPGCNRKYITFAKYSRHLATTHGTVADPTTQPKEMKSNSARNKSTARPDPIVIPPTPADDADNQLCKICFDKPIGVAMIPCGHMFCCKDCGLLMIDSHCAICRAHVTQTLIVFNS